MNPLQVFIAFGMFLVAVTGALCLVISLVPDATWSKRVITVVQHVVVVAFVSGALYVLHLLYQYAGQA